MTETDKFLGAAFAGCTIKEKIGQGGMGSVYTARHEALDRTVAVKILSPDLARDERNIEFFLREARSAAKLEHPNIVQIYNFGQENGSYFIIMSYIEGKSLSDMIAEKGPMTTDTATGIILEVLDGLGHAHSKTIIHRDIKPSNILLGADGHPKIVDFGLARSISEEKQLTMAGEMVGTAYFMSPEQGLAAKVDHRADLYSTGATYFYLLTAKYPFEGKSSIEVIHKHIGEPFPNILVLKPDIPLWVSHVLERLMRKKPESRYQSAAEVANDIKRRITAEKDGTSVSNERSIDLPEVSALFANSSSDSPVPPPPPDHKLSEAALTSDRRMPAQTGEAGIPGTATAPRKDLPKPKQLQLSALHNSIRTAMHFAITFAAIGCFLLAGSTGTPRPGLLASLLSPFTSSQSGAGFFLAAGLGLISWTIFLKPLKFTPMHAFFSAAAALAAYAGAIFVPSPETTDMVSKAFFCLKTAVENMASPSNLLLYSLFLFLAASKFVLKPHWAAKAGSVIAYGLSLLLTYIYFKGGAQISPEKTYLALAGFAAAIGLTAALTQKQFAFIFNPALLFLTANGLIFAMFTNPWIYSITEKKVSEEALRVEKLKNETYYKYRRELAAQEAAIPEFDTDGRPIEKKPVASPQETSPVPREELRRAARAEYYKSLVFKLKDNLLETAGLVFIALFLMLMTNIYFVEETMSHY
ncbi:MAG: hypothetical protein A2270_06600 [Elusimicrobia bacterium RIFOXYA12_FULL_51_18]|nr:MAG: hypothetical protein A2270_06600 [Elusimicrobia bacterium RIFOXYA12_FULL_51_18]OGS29693.1 MAG: hypothetical protein A2218_03260 [Elusimicrobia bacterium RIFOXYA2_FULL_53_38]